MAHSQLPNYLRAYRKRLALSQEEVAFLLGTESGAKVSRYECFMREPNLRAVLAYIAICQAPARELFAGLYRYVEINVASRAKTLLSKLDGRKTNRRVGRKREVLAKLAARKPPNSRT